MSTRRGGGRLACRFAELARRGIEGHGGVLLELRGDEGSTSSARREAVRAEVHLQWLFRERTDGEHRLPLRVGIGLDAGEAVPVEGGHRGAALNLAGSLCSLAGPGEVLASSTVASRTGRVQGFASKSAGLQRLKGFRPERPSTSGSPRMRWDSSA